MAKAKKKQIKKVVIFGGSKFGNDPIYEQHADEVGTLLGQEVEEVFYGGGQSGLMGIFAGAARNAGAKVTGVITQAFKNSVYYKRLEGTEEIVVSSLGYRKKLMISKSDAGIILPGGVGTQDEQWEMVALIDMNIAGRSNAYLKPVIVLNTKGIYDPLKAQMKALIAEGFIHPGREKLVRSVDTPLEVVQKIRKWNSEGIMRAVDVANAYAEQISAAAHKLPVPK
jgi:uncharacterized protein (TIGR00730 family)